MIIEYTDFYGRRKQGYLDDILKEAVFNCSNDRWILIRLMKALINSKIFNMEDIINIVGNYGYNNIKIIEEE